MRTVHAIVLSMLLAVAGLVLADEPGTIGPDALAARLKAQDVTVIDVRTPAEYGAGHVPGAINIPHDKIQEHLDDLTAVKSRDLVLYCRSGRRTQLAIETLKTNGFQHLFHLEGDLPGWQAGGRAVEETPSGPPTEKTGK